MSEKAPFMVFSGTNSRYLAEKICASLNCPLGNMNITHFADGEFAVSYEESIRGAHVFLVQSTFPNSDNLMENSHLAGGRPILTLTGGALKRLNELTPERREVAAQAYIKLTPE